MKFKPKPDEPRGTSEPYYELNNGYIKPETMLVNQEDWQAIYDALELIERFLNEAEEKGHIGIW